MEDFDPILGPHQTELYYLLYNAFYLLGRDFSYGSFVPKTVVSGKYLFIVIIQYPCPKCPLKNIRGQTLTILKHSMKPKCKMYLKSSTCLISLSEPTTWHSSLKAQYLCFHNDFSLFQANCFSMLLHFAFLWSSWYRPELVRGKALRRLSITW